MDDLPLAQAEIAQAAEDELLQQGRDGTGTVPVTELKRRAAEHHKQAKASEKVAAEILGRYRIKTTKRE